MIIAEFTAIAHKKTQFLRAIDGNLDHKIQKTAESSIKPAAGRTFSPAHYCFEIEAVPCYLAAMAAGRGRPQLASKKGEFPVHDLQNVGTVARVIQLSVAPVFLLTAIGTLLSVMTNRLGRIIDRARVLEARLETAPPEAAAKLQTYLGTLSHRADLIGHSITLCTVTAVLVCTVIATLFVGDYLRYDMSMPVAILFILAMLLLVIGLINFLREVFVARASLRIGAP